MKQHTGHLKLILAAALLIQGGCSGNHANQRGSYLYSGTSTAAGGHSDVGNALGGGQSSTTTGWGNALDQANQIFGPADKNTPIADADGDKVADASDKCPGTPAGVAVDASGCEVVKKKEDDEKSGKFTINEEATDWTDVCSDGNKGLKFDADKDGIGDDTDGDGIKDECEEELKGKEGFIGLDKNVFNGALVSGMKFDKRDAKLTNDEESDYKKKVKEVMGVGKSSDVSGYFNRNIMKKFLAISYQNKSDMKAMKALYSINKNKSEKAIQVNGDLKDRGNTELNGALKSLPAVLVKQNETERIPFALSEDNLSVSNLTGMATNTISFLDRDELIYIAETYLVVPTSGKDVKLRVGSLLGNNEAIAGSKTGMFYVMTDNNSVIMTSDLIADKLRNKDDLDKSYGTIAVSSKCETIHVVIAFLASNQKLKAMREQEALFSENVFIFDEDANTYKHIPQEMMRTQPLGGEKCNEDPNNIVLDAVAAQVSKAVTTNSNNEPSEADKQKAEVQKQLTDLQNAEASLEGAAKGTPEFDAAKTTALAQIGKLKAMPAGALDQNQTKKLNELEDLINNCLKE